MLNKRVQELIESAALSIDDGDSGDTSSLTNKMLAELIRANNILDKNKDSLLFDLLNLSKKEDIMRAAQSYDYSFLIDQHLSLGSLQDLCRELIVLAKKYGVTPPQVWTDFMLGNTQLPITEETEDDQVIEERYRSPDL